MWLALNRDYSPGPGAYRKAQRCIRMASRLGLPVVTLIDTPGANPSEGSETGGLAWEIAATFEVLLSASVPVVSVVTGEGGSGGALALATADKLLAYRDSFFSVIGPEAAAAILWRDAGRAGEMAAMLRLTAPDLLRLGVVDGVVDEELTDSSITRVVAYHLDLLSREAERDWAARRRDRWRNKDDGNR